MKNNNLQLKQTTTPNPKVNLRQLSVEELSQVSGGSVANAVAGANAGGASLF